MKERTCLGELLDVADLQAFLEDAEGFVDLAVFSQEHRQHQFPAGILLDEGSEQRFGEIEAFRGEGRLFRLRQLRADLTSFSATMRRRKPRSRGSASTLSTKSFSISNA